MFGNCAFAAFHRKGATVKKKITIAAIIILLLVLLVPIPAHVKDGGTVVYGALVYRVHRLAIQGDGYEEGIIIEILGFEVFNNVR